MTSPVPAEPRISVVVVSHNTREDLLRCLASLRSTVRVPFEIIVVDNDSHDGSAAAAARDFPDARVVASRDNVGFARGNNIGARLARGAYLLVLNSDAEVREGCVESLCRVLDERAEVGIVGPRTLSGDGTPQVSFGTALTPLAEWRQGRLVRGVRRREPEALAEAAARAAQACEPDWVSGACLLARRRAYDAVGGFDESFFLYEEDVDLCVRVRAAGFKVAFAPEAVVVHHLGRSMASAPARARYEYQRSHVLYYRKHNGPLWTFVLRAFVLASAGLRWLGAVGPGLDRRQRRAWECRTAAFAALGRCPQA